MDKQPESLRLAQCMSEWGLQPAIDNRHEAAAELRRLHKSLTVAGFTDEGGELRKPPLGPSASPLIARIDAQAALIAELVEALQGLDEAYCRAGSPLSRAERNEDRQRLIAARAALSKAKEQ